MLMFYANPFFLPSTVDFVHLDSTLLSCCAVSRLGKRPTALSIDSPTGVTHASRGNSTSSKLRSRSSVLPRLPTSNTHKGVPRWRHCKFYALRTIPYRHTYKSQKFFFCSWVTGFVRDPSHHIETPTWISTRRFMTKGGTGDYLLRFWRSHAWVPQRLYRQTLLWLVIRSRSLSILEEQNDRKKRDAEQSAPTHACHTHCTPMHLGTTADWSMTFFGTDFMKHAIWQGSVEEPTAKDFVARKVRTIVWNEV
jgi:hypothetical protein